MGPKVPTSGSVRRMYVCLCNRLSESMIAEAVANGARTPMDVFRRLHLRRGCSSCTVRIAEVIDQARAQGPHDAAE